MKRWAIFVLPALWAPVALTLGAPLALGEVDLLDVFGEGAIFFVALAGWFALPSLRGLPRRGRQLLMLALALVCLAQFQDVLDEFFVYAGIVAQSVENLSKIAGALLVLWAVLHLSTHVRDITSERKRILDKSVRDPLTGLLNRTTLDDALEEAVDRAADGEAVCLIYADLDSFKDVNDRHGHAYGDEVIRRMARTIAGLVRTGDRAFRIGGDEFIVLLFDTALEDGEAVAERIREGFLVMDDEGPQTASIGVVACMPREAPGSFLARGDAALYAAKRDGRNRVHAADHPRPVEAPRNGLPVK